jgi:hypothetical protein
MFSRRELGSRDEYEGIACRVREVNEGFKRVRVNHAMPRTEEVKYPRIGHVVDRSLL